MSLCFNLGTNEAKSAAFTAQPIRSLLSLIWSTLVPILAFDWLISSKFDFS